MVFRATLDPGINLISERAYGVRGMRQGDRRHVQMPRCAARRRPRWMAASADKTHALAINRIRGKIHHTHDGRLENGTGIFCPMEHSSRARVVSARFFFSKAASGPSSGMAEAKQTGQNSQKDCAKDSPFPSEGRGLGEGWSVAKPIARKRFSFATSFGRQIPKTF